MSVSSHLADRSSPLRRFFEAELGNTRELVSEANATLRGGQTRPPLPTVGNPGLVGTAADILLNAWLDPVEPPGRMAQSPTMDGARFIGDSQFALMGRFKQPDPPKPDEWPQLVRHGLLLAAFVSTFRSLYAQRLVREQLQGAEPSFEEYARRLWKPDDERDLLTLAPAVLADHVFASSGLAANCQSGVLPVQATGRRRR